MDVVLIDDSRQYLLTTQQILEKQGLKIGTISDPSEAVQQLISLQPKLIVLDVMMPGLDGFTLLKQIKEEPALSSTSVVILSGKVFATDQKKALALGADKYLTKPILARKLVKEIQAYL